MMQQQTPTASINLDDQRTNGTAITISSITANGRLELHLQVDDSLVGRYPLQVDGKRTDIGVGISPSLSTDSALTVVVYDPDIDEALASDRAILSIDAGHEGIEPSLIEANPDAGFNYPYFLYAPPQLADCAPVSILVESTNIAGPSDGLDQPTKDSRLRIERGSARRIADALATPLVIPVFPRPASTPVDWTHYTHQLDRETMQIESGPLQRIDRQLLAMVDDARERLESHDWSIRDRFMLNGFSASAKFANRFTALHPERVLSVTAGGINGTPILPASTVNDLSVPYHVGVADLAELTGSPFDIEAFRSVPQFLYMGELDDNDAMLYPDAWTGVELRKAGILVYGEDMHTDRFPTSKAVYDAVDASAAFRLYAGVDHTPRPAEIDCIAFHHRRMAGSTPTSLVESFDDGFQTPEVSVGIDR